MKIAGYEFSGPWVLPTTLSERPGVYVVLCEAIAGYRVLEVGEADDVLEALCDHEHKSCKSIYCSGSLRFAAHYCDAGSCPKIVSEVKRHLEPPCGRIYNLTERSA